MIYTTRYDILLNYLLCAADMLILARLMSRMYGPVIRHKRLLTGISALGILALMLMPAPYDNTFLTVPLSFLLLWFYPKTRKKSCSLRAAFLPSFSPLSLFLTISQICSQKGAKSGLCGITWRITPYYGVCWYSVLSCAAAPMKTFPFLSGSCFS